MKNTELRTLPVEEVKQLLDDALDELANLRISKAMHQLANPQKIRMVRKDIARYKTLIREYQLGISEPKNKS